MADKDKKPEFRDLFSDLADALDLDIVGAEVNKLAKDREATRLIGHSRIRTPILESDLRKQHFSPHRLSKQAIDILYAISGKGFIAGGYARYVLHPKYSPKPSDIDIFSYKQDMTLEPDDRGDQQTRWWARSPLITALESLGYIQTRNTPNAVEMEGNKRQLKLQVIMPFENQYMRTYGSAMDVLSLFDFTIAMAALEYISEHNEFWATYHKSFRKDNRSHQLHISHINCPIAVSMRVTKMSSKGYYIGPRELIKLFKDWTARPEQYRARLTELCDRDELSPTEWFELEKLLRID